MIMTFAVYFGLATLALCVLGAMIFRIGDALTDCPATGRAARAGAMTIVTGFGAIGGGAVIIGGAAALALLPLMNGAGVMAALGFTVLCLGLGFTQAVATLRDVIARAADQAALVAPAAPEAAA